MSLVPQSMRVQVAARAENRCEYCHIPTRGQVAPFPIDHVIPRSRGGATSLDNLAMSCPKCNGHKWKHEAENDPLSGQSVPLFNPRLDSWPDHFVWSSREVGVLVTKTAVGRATVARLQINQPDQVSLRQLLASVGLFPELLPHADPPT